MSTALPLRAVFFDAGGTLLRLRGTVGAIYSARAAHCGLHVEATALERAFHDAFRAAPPLAFPDAPAAALPSLEREWWRRLVRATFGAATFPDFDAFFDALYAEFATDALWEVYPDVVPMLERLRRRGLHCGVISNFDGRLVTLLEALGIARLIDSVTLSSRVGSAKPDPGIFAVALRAHGLLPGEAIHVGDSEREDIAGAEAAGMRALLVRGDSGRDLDALESLLDL